MNLPNLFNFATSELSQDAAIAYHLAWADLRFKTTHPQHHALGTELLKLFVNEKAPELNIGNVEIEVKLQVGHVDICVGIGSKALLIIEDKTNSSEHSGQIERYQGVAKGWKDPEGNEWGPERVIVAYLKTGNESRKSEPKAAHINKVRRSTVLAVLSAHQATGDQICDQFRAYLQNWEDDTHSYRKIPVSQKWSWHATQGFYSKLEEIFEAEKIDTSGWGYVSNAASGFLAFHWSWVWITDLRCHLYLQMEDAKRLVIRVGDAQDADGKPIPAGANLRWTLLGRLQELASKETYSPMKIDKSGRYKPGQTGGVAYVENYLAVDEYGLIDMQATVINLKLIAELLREAAH